jgi:hypothetical protein
MRREARVIVTTLVLAAGVPVGSAGAHLHPFVPAAGCAPDRTGAGNESEGIRTSPWAPDSGAFIITESNPGNADASNGAIADPFAGNPGENTAEAHCADPERP